MKNCTYARLRVLVVACATVFSISFSFAQASSEAALDSPRRLKEVVVTATRTPTRSDELVSDVVVIDKAMIEASTARTLPELLARLAGLQIAATGGPGALSSVFIRGTESRHTILLIDGVRYGSATAGIPVWEGLPLDLIERVEVLKGPGSALYGSEGAGGVVQIFTRKGQAGWHPYAQLSVGSLGFKQTAVGLSGGQGGVSYALSLQTQRQTGFSATNSKASSSSYNPDRDGLQQDALNASVSMQVHPDWQVSGSVLQTDGLTHLDDGLSRDAQTALRTQVAQLGVKGRMTPSWQSELRVAQSLDKNEALVASSLPARFQTTQNQITWQNDVGISRLGVLSLGVEQLVQKVDSSTAYDVTTRTTDAYFLGANGSAGVHSWQVNWRRDSNSQFGDNNTGFAGYGFALTENWRVNASRGTSFVAPSFNQLYFPSFSNPGLRPERGTNTDLGLSYSAGVHQVKLIRFDNKIRDLIVSSSPSFIPANVQSARIEGWTLGYDGSIGKLALRAQWDTLNPRNEATGRTLQRRAKEQLNLGADYNFGAWSLGGTFLAAGSRFNDTANTQNLAGYATLDIYASRKLAKDWQVQAKINNVADKAYETAYGYNQPGRGAFLTLKYTPH